MTATADTRAIRPSDFLDLDRSLTDEERDIRDTVRAYVVDECFRTSATGSRRRGSRSSSRAELGELGVLGMHLEGYGCAGASATAYGLACLELEAGDSGAPQPRLGAGLARDVRDPPLRLRGAEASGGCRRWPPAR